MRTSGILYPVSSLPSKYGIGCFSKEAYEFVDFLKKAGQTYWQVLPFGPTGYGDSPYQSFSVYAGNPYFIDFETLEKQGLLEHEDYASMLWQRSADEVDYELLYRSNITVLRRAFARFVQKPMRGYTAYKKANAAWLPDYALFMALKAEHDGGPWYEWEKPLAMRDKAALDEARARLKN